MASAQQPAELIGHIYAWSGNGASGEPPDRRRGVLEHRSRGCPRRCTNSWQRRWTGSAAGLSSRANSCRGSVLGSSPSNNPLVLPALLEPRAQRTQGCGAGVTSPAGP